MITNEQLKKLENEIESECGKLADAADEKGINDNDFKYAVLEEMRGVSERIKAKFGL